MTVEQSAAGQTEARGGRAGGEEEEEEEEFDVFDFVPDLTELWYVV